MKTEDVQKALRSHFTGRDQAIVFEVPDGVSGDASRYADAVVVNFWRSRGLEIEGMEIKVTRSDWKRELDMPRKADAHFCRCDRWWLVTPVPGRVAVAASSEIPPAWGWLGVSAVGGIQVIKKAPKLVPAPPPDRGYFFGLIRAAARWDDKAVQAQVARAVAKADQDFTARVNAAAARLKAPKGHVDEPLMAKLREAFGNDINWLRQDGVVETIRAVRDLSVTRRYESFAATAEALRAAADKVERAADALSRVVPE